MTTLATLRVALVGDISDFATKIADAQGQMEKLGSKISNVGGAITRGVSAPLIGAGTAAVIMGNQFNAGLANVISLAPEAAGKIEGMRGGIQDLAVDVGKSTGDMTAGMYQVVSAFGLSEDSLAVLRTNAIAAAAGLATTEEAINLTSAVTKAYGDTSAGAVSRVADLAMQTVAMGQTTFPELAASIGRVTPLAASMGVSMNELFGVMATGSGVTGSAAEVSTQFRGILQSLMAPTESMTAAFAELGVTTGAELIDIYGLEDGLHNIMMIAEESGEPLQSYISSIEGQTLAMALAGPQADAWSEKTEAMRNSAGAATTAFEAQTQGVNAAGFAMQQAVVQVQVLAQQIGNALAPVVLAVVPLFQRLVDWIGGLVGKFQALDPRVQTAILAVAGVAAALGPLLMIIGPVVSGITALSTVVTAVGAVLGALLSPIGLVVAAIAALAIAWATDFGGIRTTVTQFWNAHLRPIFTVLVTWLKTTITEALRSLSEFWRNTLLPAIKVVWEFIQTNLIPLLKALVNVWLALLKLALKALQGLWENVLLPAIKAVWAFLQDKVIPIIEKVVAKINDVLGPALTVVKDLFDKVGGAIGGIIGNIQDVIGWLQSLADRISSIQLPGWLMPGSPTPFEIGLRGIASAAQQASGGIRQLSGSTRTMLSQDVGGWLQESRRMVQMVLDILGAVGGEENVGRAKTFAEAVSAILDAVNGLVESAAGIAKVRVPANLMQAVDLLMDSVRGIAARFAAAAAVYKEEQMAAAKTFAEMAKAAIETLTSMAALINSAATMSRANVDTALATMLALVERIAAGFGAMAGRLDSQAVTAAAAMSEALRQILDVVKPGIDAIQALTGYTTAAGIRASADAFIGDLVRVARALRNGFNDLNPAAKATFEQAGVWADLTRPLIDVIKPGVDAIRALAEYAPVANLRASADAFVADLVRVARALRNGFNNLNPAARATFEQAGVWAELTRPLIDVIKPGVDAIRVLFEYAPVAGIRASADAFIADLVSMARSLAEGMPLMDDLLSASLDNAVAFGQRVQQIAGAVKPGADAMAALMAYAPIKGIADKTAMFVTDLVAMAKELAGNLPVMDALLTGSLDNAVAFGQRAQQMVGVIKPGADAMQALANYKPIADIRSAVTAFVNDLMAMAKELVGGFPPMSEALTAAMDSAVAFGQRAQQMVGVIKPGVDAMQAMANYRLAKDIRGVVALFVADLVAMAEELRLGMPAMSEALTASMDSAVTFGQRAQQMVGVIKPGIDAMQAMANYRLAKDIGGVVALFVADLVAMAEELRLGMPAMSEALTASMDSAVAFGQRAQQMVGVIKPGIDAIRAVGEYAPVAGLRGAVRAFVSDVLVVAEELRTGLSGASDAVLAAMDSAAAYGKRIDELLGYVRPGIEGLRALAGFWRLDTLRSGVQLFSEAAVAAVTMLREAFTNASLADVQAAAAWMAQIGLLLETVNSTLGTANTLFRTVAQPAWGPILAVLDAFLTRMAGPAFAAGETWIRALADGILAGMTYLEAALAAVADMFPHSPAKAGPLREAPDWRTWMLGGLGEAAAEVGAALAGVGGNGALAAAGAGGGNVTINMYGSWQVREERDIERIGQAVAEYLARQTATQKRLVR